MKPPKENEKRRKQIRSSERGNNTSYKEYDNRKITMTKRYMYLWHVCLILANVLAGILVTIGN